jgi:6-phosphofructokinase 1
MSLMLPPAEMVIPVLGPATADSPLLTMLPKSSWQEIFIDESERILLDPDIRSIQECLDKGEKIPSFETAGPRNKIYFDPAKVTAAIVTCGGVCPGLNDVIRSVVMTLSHRYGVKKILGIRNGYQGFIEKYSAAPLSLTPEAVSDIHKKGGTILGTSRGSQKIEEIVDFLERNNISMLFVIGGDGTQRGALEIAQMTQKKGMKTVVVGIPKTVDNDILYLDRSFGFATAVSVACRVIETAHNEAVSQPNGIGLVKFMGRYSGFITCLAALAVNDANFVLIPEVPFKLDGKNGFLASLKERLQRRSHAVVLVAEGAGQDLIPSEGEGRDASGNLRFKDIGIFLKDKINDYFKNEKMEVYLKYIDPSYIIRAVPAMPVDNVYCYLLGEKAVHAAMSGKTEMVVGLVNNQYVHIPMRLIAQGRKQVDPKGSLWLSVLETTGQPAEMR